MEIAFNHRQSAHCESGVTANLISHYGHKVSEAMAFGIGAGLFFGYIPFIRLNHLPLTTFRCVTGNILKRATRSLGIVMQSQTFRNPEAAMTALDSVLEQGIPVGIQTGAYWLPYFPPAYRFHFNMHNSVVIGREGEVYKISDPVFPEPVLCPRRELMFARFAKGVLAPHGRMYFFTNVPENLDLATAVTGGINAVTKSMLSTPIPIIGVRGIRFLANRLEKWPHNLGEAKAILHLGQLVRMQEEIGTGGAGFRFMFAAFLQEAAQVLAEPRLQDLSARMTLIGDLWREFAVSAARNCKGRAGAGDSYPAMAGMLRNCAADEEALYRDLRALVG